MTLNDLKDTIELITEKRSITFGYGEEFHVGNGAKQTYPIVFLEMPYNVDYLLKSKKKSIQFALLVLYKSKEDDIEGDHLLISDAERISESLIMELQTSLMELKVDSATAVSVREFSDDNLAGVRLEIKALTGLACK